MNEISDSIRIHSESAMFDFETRSYHVDVSLYEDGGVMIQIWNFKEDCPCTKPNVESFIAKSLSKWSGCISSKKETDLKLQEQFEMRRAI